MIQSNDFSSSQGRALQFMLVNSDNPLLTSYNSGGMYLQGQAVSFVYLSGVFFVIAGVVVVMLGVHMVVLARRLLSEAIVLLRTSTICISASLHLSQLSRKTLSSHYKKLDVSARSIKLHVFDFAVDSFSFPPLLLCRALTFVCSKISLSSAVRAASKLLTEAKLRLLPLMHRSNMTMRLHTMNRTRTPTSATCLRTAMRA
jgi:hypothetical protein